MLDYALSGSILHWTCKQFPKWLIEVGLIDGKRPPRPPMQEILTLKVWLATQRHFAEEVGEIAFYVAIILLVAVLIKCIPYRWFAKLHILIVPSYLALVWHTIVLANFAYWSQPLGWLLIAALLAGIACSLICPIQAHRQPAKRHRIRPESKRQTALSDPERPEMARTPRRTIPLFTRTRRKPPRHHRLQLAA